MSKKPFIASEVLKYLLTHNVTETLAPRPITRRELLKVFDVPGHDETERRENLEEKLQAISSLVKVEALYHYSVTDAGVQELCKLAEQNKMISKK
jgi:hypothetical protein